MREHFLENLPVEQILAAFDASPGNEIASGKFASPESSAALVANAFGYFLNAPGALPTLPGVQSCGWPVTTVELEREVRFPWAGGRHPWLDVLVETRDTLIGIESKRFEPFRGHKETSWSAAYWRDWGTGMTPYAKLRDKLKDRSLCFEALDAGQLVKHAFGLSTARSRMKVKKRVLLFYLFHEPCRWPDGRPIPRGLLEKHRTEVAEFGQAAAGAEVCFSACTYVELIKGWVACPDRDVREHAWALAQKFEL